MSKVRAAAIGPPNAALLGNALHDTVSYPQRKPRGSQAVQLCFFASVCSCEVPLQVIPYLSSYGALPPRQVRVAAPASAWVGAPIHRLSQPPKPARASLRVVPAASHMIWPSATRNSTLPGCCKPPLVCHIKKLRRVAKSKLQR
jgi:hypothetical protein